MVSLKEQERLISSTIENLPPPFMIFGKKTEPNPLEDFWMSKIEAIERQYNEHIVKLQRSLLSDRIQRSHLRQKGEQVTKLKKNLNEKQEKLQTLSKHTTKLENKLGLQNYKVASLKGKLSKEEDLKEKVKKSLEQERHERVVAERELGLLRLKLKQLERDKKYLVHEISVKENEKTRIEEREGKIAQNKLKLIRGLTELEQERRIQTNTNVKLEETMGLILDVNKSQEYKIIQQRKEMDRILEEMKQQRLEHLEALRKLGFRDKELQDVEDETTFSREKLLHFERQVKHWKEEFGFKGLEKGQSSLEIKDLQRENSNLRCQLAEMREKFNKNTSKVKCLEAERHRTELELNKAKGQAKSVQMVICRNELLKQRLAEKILKTNPGIKVTLDRRAEEAYASRKWVPKDRSEDKKEIESYKNKIWNLERQKDDLERQINESKRSQSRLKTKLDKYVGMEKQILWTEKAMVKLEGDKNRLEDLMKTMAIKVPKKLPFQHLVTDPSIMDRVAKYQVLQTRLSQQSHKVEELKKNAIRVMEFQKLKYEDDFIQRRREPSPWRLSFWKRQPSEDTLADLDNQLLEPEGTSLLDRKYYKDYLSHLDHEIPEVRKQIAVLEKRQHHQQQMLQDVEQLSEKKRLEDQDALEATSGDALPRGEPTETKIIVDNVPADLDEFEEDMINDSDMEGLLGAVSIEDPSFMVGQSESLRQDSKDNGKDNQGDKDGGANLEREGSEPVYDDDDDEESSMSIEHDRKSEA